jgi:hypothetical protein
MGARKEGSKVQGSPFRVGVFKRLTAGTFQPLNPEPGTAQFSILIDIFLHYVAKLFITKARRYENTKKK